MLCNVSHHHQEVRVNDAYSYKIPHIDLFGAHNLSLWPVVRVQWTELIYYGKYLAEISDRPEFKS